ncbi:hypothetical protein [Fusobacterium animalis]|uniref:hypothetical protein n=1 Tax=Fusobacterium animalis TaxID=76859 RepID=UPI0034DF4875
MISPKIIDFANNYLKKHKSKGETCKDMINKQLIKYTTSGVINGFGEIVTMPIAIPTNQT